MPFEKYLASIVNLVKTGYKTNAFAPYVWFTAVIAIIEILLMLILTDIFIRRVLTFTFVATVGFGMFMYWKLFKKDPKLLQSESFRLEDKKLDMIGQKGSEIIVNPVDLTIVSLQPNDGGKDD